MKRLQSASKGERFGLLVATGRQFVKMVSGGKGLFFEVICVHGNARLCRAPALRGGFNKSCKHWKICRRKRQIVFKMKYVGGSSTLKQGFSDRDLLMMWAIGVCQYPGCRIKPTNRRLSSDHCHACKFHGSGIMCPNCYRGQICDGHNRLLTDLDLHSEWANSIDLNYMNRRPFAERKDGLFVY